MGEQTSRTSSMDDLAAWLSGARRIVIVGVGNPLRRDDNVGVETIEGLEGKALQNVLLIKSETVPEEFMEQIVDFRPTHILIIDAALLDLAPGSARLTECLQTSRTPVSTHALPIQIFCEYLAKMTGAKIAMLLIQPKDTSFGEGLTHELELAREKLVSHLVRIVGQAVES